MVMVVREILEEHLAKIKKCIFANQQFIEMQNLALKNNLKVSFTTYETKRYNQTLVFISVSVLDISDKVYEVPESSDFYDEIGSLGGAENIFSYQKRTSSIKKYELTNDFWDDIRISIEYLKSIEHK